ncbi:uncharacterized protein isoform X2 [Castor canadensis]|uniref:Uncharacterized protein isoform X2 n=2 Tax=Castor canadensis TaxID=51338 RepID=A0AC58MRX3_CASCN
MAINGRNINLPMLFYIEVLTTSMPAGHKFPDLLAVFVPAHKGDYTQDLTYAWNELYLWTSEQEKSYFEATSSSIRNIHNSQAMESV